VLKFCGIGESVLDEQLSDLLKSTNPTIAPSAKFSEVHLRVTAKARQAHLAEEMIDAMESRIRERLGTYIFGVSDDTLPGVVTQILREQGKTIAVAESFTGGQLAYQLSSASGAEHTFIAGLVARDYQQLQDKACLQLGDIPPKAGDGAGHMASALRKQFGTDIGVAVAVEPVEDEQSIIPEYNLYIAVDCNGYLMLKKVLWSGERDVMARRAAIVVLVFLWRYLKHGIIMGTGRPSVEKKECQAP
jgi:nicotinamide-nucleotide amidase